MFKITHEECDILLEALDVWELSESKDGLFGQTMKMMFAESPGMSEEERKESIHEEAEVAMREQDEIKERTKIKKEKTIMIKAKLLSLRDSLGIDSLLESDKC